MVAALTIGISAVALVVSIYALIATQKRDRRDLFLQMHHLLTDKDLQEGRRLLYETINSVDDVRQIRQTDPARTALINRALSTFELLAFYVQRGYIDKQLMLEEWGHTYARAWLHGRHFVVERLERERDGWSGWPHLQTLAPEAEQWAAEHPPKLLANEGSRAPHGPPDRPRAMLDRRS